MSVCKGQLQAVSFENEVVAVIGKVLGFAHWRLER